MNDINSLYQTLMTEWSWSYEDIAKADYERLMEIISSKKISGKGTKTPMPLEEFIKTI